MIKIYTDGSSIGNPGPWWWAILVLSDWMSSDWTLSNSGKPASALVGAGAIAQVQSTPKSALQTTLFGWLEDFQSQSQQQSQTQEQSQHTIESANRKIYPKKKGTHEAISLSWWEEYSTNNRMELTAVISAYLYLEEKWYIDQEVVLHMDSKYVHDGLEVYLDQRIARWRRLANKKPVLNVDLRKQLYELRNNFPQVQLERVKAHHTDKYNNFVDRLARKEAGMW